MPAHEAVRTQFSSGINDWRRSRGTAGVAAYGASSSYASPPSPPSSISSSTTPGDRAGRDARTGHPPLTLRYGAQRSGSDAYGRVRRVAARESGDLCGPVTHRFGVQHRTSSPPSSMSASSPSSSSTAGMTTSYPRYRDPVAWSSQAHMQAPYRSSQRTPERHRTSRYSDRRDTRSESASDGDYSYSYSYSYSNEDSDTRSSSSSSSSAAPSFVGSRFDRLEPSANHNVHFGIIAADSTSAATSARGTAPRRVSFAKERTEVAQSPGGTVTRAERVLTTPVPTATNTATSSAAPSETGDTTPNEATDGAIGGHGGGSHVPKPSAIMAALLRSRKGKETKVGKDKASTDGLGGEVGDDNGKSGAANATTTTTPTTSATHTPAATASVSGSHTASAASTSAAAAATVSNASRALAVYEQDTQSAAALMRAPPGSVVSAIHTINLDEEARRRRAAKEKRESVDDAILDELDDEDKQLLPYPSQLTHRVLAAAAPPPSAPPQSGRQSLAPGAPGAPGAAAASGPGGVARPQRIPAGCCITQKRARRRQLKADVRDATRQAVNDCLLRSHHVPLIPFETDRNTSDWIASGAPTFAEAAQSRWTYGVLSRAENPKALQKAMGDRQRPGRLASKTTFAYGRRAGGGPQGGGRSEFLGPNDPVLYWASQLREQTCLQLEPIDTTDVYRYLPKPTEERSTTPAKSSNTRPAAPTAPNRRLNAIADTTHADGSDEDDEQDVDTPASVDGRVAVAAAMAAASTGRPSSSSASPLIALTAHGSTTVHASSPALLSVRSRDQNSISAGNWSGN